MITDAHVALLAIGTIFAAVAVYAMWLLRLQGRLGTHRRDRS